MAISAKFSNQHATEGHRNFTTNFVKIAVNDWTKTVTYWQFLNGAGYPYVGIAIEVANRCHKFSSATKLTASVGHCFECLEAVPVHECLMRVELIGVQRDDDTPAFQIVGDRFEGQAHRCQVVATDGLD